MEPCVIVKLNINMLIPEVHVINFTISWGSIFVDGQFRVLNNIIFADACTLAHYILYSQPYFAGLIFIIGENWIPQQFPVAMDSLLMDTLNYGPLPKNGHCNMQQLHICNVLPLDDLVLLVQISLAIL